MDRYSHPSPTGLAGSDGSLRRAVRAPVCDVCGDCIHGSNQQDTLDKKGQKQSSPRPEQPAFKVTIQKENRFPDASLKIMVWIGQQYPKVTLCDIGQCYDDFSQDCGYVLPDLLKTKVVHCFKREMRAGFRFEPSCLGHIKLKNEDGALAKKGENWPKVHSEWSISQSQSLTELQTRLKESTDAQTSSSHATCRFPKNWTSEGSATCSASFLLGKRAQRECRTDMWDRDVGEDPRPGSHLTGAETLTDKRIKLGDSVTGRVLPSCPDLESITCKNPTKTHSRDKHKTCFLVSDRSQSCAEQAADSISTLVSAVNENSVHKKPCGEMEGPTNTVATQMSLGLYCQRNEVDMDELESSCQRVRVYFRKNNFSCARTYMSWPFLNSGWDRTAHAVTPACPTEPVGPSDNSDSPIIQNKLGTPGDGSNDMLLNAPQSPFSGTTQQVSLQSDGKQHQAGESFLEEGNGKTQVSSYIPDRTHMEFKRLLIEAEESLASPPSNMATLTSPCHHGRELATDSPSSLPVIGPQSDSSMSTPPPSALGPSVRETTTSFSSMSSPSLLLASEVDSVDWADASLPNCMAKVLEKPLFYCDKTRLTSCSSSYASPQNSDSCQSCESTLLLPQNKKESDGELHTGPPDLELYYNTSPFYSNEKCVETKFMLPPALSPVTSPQGHSLRSFLPHCQDYSEEEEEMKKGTCSHKSPPGCHMSRIVNGNNVNPESELEHSVEGSEGVLTNLKLLTTPREPQFSPSSYETDCEHDVEWGGKKSQPEIKATLATGLLTEPHSSSSSDDDDDGAEGSSPSEIRSNQRDQTEAELPSDTLEGILDEFTAYEKDILLVDVIQDDPELFENLPQESLLKLGPTRVPTTRPIGDLKKLLPRSDGLSPEFEQRVTPFNIDFLCDSPDVIDEGNNRPWRPQCHSTYAKTQSSTENQTKNVDLPDSNNNHENKGLERNQPIRTVNPLFNHIPRRMTLNNGPWNTNPANMIKLRHQKSNDYCRQYFSESLSCGFKMCRFQHVPVEGDEKFCNETVARFTKNPVCLQKAGAVFTGYYLNNPPGEYFSMPVFLSLLWALLKAGMVSDVFSVLSVSLAHKLLPGHEFVLALFNFVREKGLLGLVPELMQLTFKMASAGLVLSLDCLDNVKNTAEVQQRVCPNFASGRLSPSGPFPDYLNLAQAIVEIELCTKQEDWRRMGEVFRSICQSGQRPNKLEQISGRIAIALLSESKDKVLLPFAAFAEKVCQNEGHDTLVKSFFGRIGVSLMLRYHKTHQWSKGRRVVEVLSVSKVSYSTLKGLFGNEDQASRCSVVTVATELFLLSGSVEGALNALRENKWFLSTISWPCEPTDLESRTRVLLRLAEKTSHRGSLEVLCNLPGLKEPNDSVNISRYCPLFNTHLQVCVDRQMLPVASDTVDFMLSKKLSVNPSMLQILIHKLGEQNLWLRAREVFRHSLSEGYYPGVSAPPGFMALIVPCELGEVELALTFEMFISVNATVILPLTESATSCLTVTLKRTQSCESEYLSAGSRLLSAAGIPQPKLIIHYKAVNCSQEQMFTLDISSARSWLRHNHLWAKEVWTH